MHPVKRFWMALKRRKRGFLAALVLFLAGTAGVVVKPLAATRGGAWSVLDATPYLILLAALMALALAGLALQDAFDAPRRPAQP
jgi:hypothetical protein